MVAAGTRIAIMGNHEILCLAWNTPLAQGHDDGYVREHNPRHARLQRETIEQFADHPMTGRTLISGF